MRSTDEIIDEIRRIATAAGYVNEWSLKSLLNELEDSIFEYGEQCFDKGWSEASDVYY